ncbi:MAG: hypothetical protein ACRDF5_09045 [bacterium]
MRAYLPVLISILVGAVLGGFLFLLPLTRLNGSRPAPSPEATEGALRLAPADRAEVIRHALEAAAELLVAGRLREAQDEYVQVLLLAPDSVEGWAGLLRVRRLLAKDDPTVLRRQAGTYRRAIARGEETEEHYTIAAMRVLAEASERAAQGLEQARRPSPRGLGASPIVLAATPPPTARPRPAATPRRPTPRPAARAAAPTARPTPKATPKLTPVTPEAVPRGEPLYVGRTGPIVTFPQANEVHRALTAAGYTVYLSAFEGTSLYQITFGPYPKSVTDAIVRFLTSRFPELTVAVGQAP